jgi:hypothetical protein
VEYLSNLIYENSLETLGILGWEDLETLVRRAGKIPPSNPYGTPLEEYERRLIKVCVCF